MKFLQRLVLPGNCHGIKMISAARLQIYGSDLTRTRVTYIGLYKYDTTSSLKTPKLVHKLKLQMSMKPTRLTLLLLLTLSVVAAAADEPSISSGAVGNEDELDGGFSTLDGMLQWAIGHSDPEKLKESAQDVRGLSVDEIQARQREIKELVGKLNMPSDAQLMQIAIDDLKNCSLSLEDHYRALEELLILVEPLDNANDLNKLGGLAVIIQELDDPDSDVRRLSAWVLGKASQNNPLVQKQILDFGALAKLMKMARSVSVDEAVKALYAVSALIRNNNVGQELFYKESGDTLLQDLLSHSNIDIRLRRKAVFLVGDLAQGQLENTNTSKLSVFSNHLLLKSVVDLTKSTDLDLQEKALLAIKNLLKLPTTEAVVFKDFCDLGGVLNKIKHQVQELMGDDSFKEFAADLEILRSEVEIIFHDKMEKMK